MANTIHKIISFKTTETNKTFCLAVNSANRITNQIYYADIESTNSKNDASYNKCCLRTEDGLKIYNALYNAKDLYLKSAIYGNNIESKIPNTNLFLNIFNYRLSADLTNQIQVDNYIYQLNNMSIYGKQMYIQDIYSELSLNNGYALMPNIEISTLLFNRENISAAMHDDTILIDPALNINIPNIKYNQLFEIPGNIKNDYDSGNYAANVYKTKNQYNSQYDMSHSTTYKLQNARTYIAVDHCNDLIYLKYYDNVNYKNNGTIDNTKLTSELYGHKFLKIEVLKKLNRFESINTHKTNYYDIDIICEKLFLSFNNEYNKHSLTEPALSYKISKIKNNLKYEIQNCVQSFCRQLTPVDTQLVKVNVLDSETSN